MEYLDGSHATEQGGCCCHRPQFDAASIVYSYSQDTDAKHSRLLGRIEHMVPVSSVHSSENQLLAVFVFLWVLSVSDAISNRAGCKMHCWRAPVLPGSAHDPRRLAGVLCACASNVVACVCRCCSSAVPAKPPSPTLSRTATSRSPAASRCRVAVGSYPSRFSLSRKFSRHHSD